MAKRLDADIVCKAILKEMDRAHTFHHIELAWKALLNVRRIDDGIQKELDMLNPEPQCNTLGPRLPSKAPGGKPAP